MTKARTIRLGKLEKGPNGRNLCRWCKTEVKPPRRTFCSEQCIEQWQIRSNPGYAKQKVLKRDKGVCCLCGIDCVALIQQFQEHIEYGRRQGYFYLLPTLPADAILRIDELINNSTTMRQEQRDRMVRLSRLIGQYPWAYRAVRGRRRTLWDMDHVKPVVEGGGQCGLDNLRTLCISCHLDETKKLRKRMAGTDC